MATVPLLQQTPTEQIDTGGTPLFSATDIQPVQDTGVAQDIQKLSNTQKQFAQIAAALQDEQDDIKSNEAYRGYQEEADVKVNEYLNLQRGDAIATVGHDEETDKPITRYDQLVNDLTEISEKYLETLDNKNQKTLFSNKYAASKRISVNSASKHSLRQSRLKLTEESKANIAIQKDRAINSFETWQQGDGDYQISYLAGLAEIKRNAELNGRNTDINAGPLSSKYLLDVQTYNKAVMEGVVKKLSKLPGGHALAKAYVLAQKPPEIKDVPTELEIKIAEKHEDYNVEQCVDGALNNNGDQNSGSYVDQASLMMCLKSNHYVDDGKGASVHDGLHSDDVNIAGQTQEDNNNTLEKIRSESKFYMLGSNATLIDEHQPTHLFAVQHLGVQKADSLYTKAKSSVEIDTARYKEDATYAKQINEKIIDNYNELINEEANKKYEGDFVAAIANDLEIIERGINYDGEVTSDVDFVTGLRPLNVLKQELKDTITDPKQLKYALKDLENKYKKISSERTRIYNEGLNKAKEIAFAEKGGWKNLEANGIDIENFTEADQKILKNGPPEESNIEVLAKIDANPEEARDNLPAYRHQLSQSDYVGLQNYAKGLRSDNKYIEATGDNTLFKDTLYKNGHTWVYGELKGDNAVKFHSMKTAWINRIDYVQTHVENRKLNREEKLKLLNNVLIDDVYTGLGIKETPMSFLSIKPDQLKKTWVDVQVKQENGKFKKERIYGSDIKPLVQSAIMAHLYRNRKAMSQQKIAEIWDKFGRPTSVEQFKKNVEAATLSLSNK